MSRRLYLGSTYTLTQISLFSSLRRLAELPPDTRSDDVSKFFDGYGKIIDCRVMTGQLASLHLFFLSHEVYPENEIGFGFVEFESARVRFFFTACAPIDLDKLGCRGCITSLQRQKLYGPEVYIYSFTRIWRTEWTFTVLLLNSLRSHVLVVSPTKRDMGILKLFEGKY
jgi:hypothetical protein